MAIPIAQPPDVALPWRQQAALTYYRKNNQFRTACCLLHWLPLNVPLASVVPSLGQERNLLRNYFVLLVDCRELVSFRSRGDNDAGAIYEPFLLLSLLFSFNSCMQQQQESKNLLLAC